MTMEKRVRAAIEKALASPGAGVEGLGTRDLEELGRHAANLREMGFEIQVRGDGLRVHHASGFDAVVPVGDPDDLDPLRTLLRALRSAFGGALERWLPGCVQAGPAVTRPYESIKAVLGACQRLRGPRPA
jgi:hypothetical protein